VPDNESAATPGGRGVADDPLSLAHEIALATRNFEIKLFWQRSNYFLVLNTAVAVGFFSQTASSWRSLALCLLGAGIAALWIMINLGSKFWQSRWERRLELIESQLPPELRLFSAGWPTLRREVLSSLARPYRKRGRVKRRLARIYVGAVLQKPSVSRVMTGLSVLFLVFWVAAAGVTVTKVFDAHSQPNRYHGDGQGQHR